ncbi:hypothetical protein ACJENL_27125, partial [Escherichia coli]
CQASVPIVPSDRVRARREFVAGSSCAQMGFSFFRYHKTAALLPPCQQAVGSLGQSDVHALELFGLYEFLLSLLME